MPIASKHYFQFTGRTDDRCDFDVKMPVVCLCVFLLSHLAAWSLSLWIGPKTTQ